MTAGVIVVRQSDEALGGRLSPSQLRKYANCPASWWFRYGRGLPDAQTGKSALGTAVHEALAQNWRYKIETGGDLPVADVQLLFSRAWTEVAKGVAWRDEENPGEFGATGAKLVALYMRDRAPQVHPAAVEIHVEGEIGGVPVQGWIDLLEEDGTITDVKTAARKPGESFDPNYRMQVAVYAAITPGASGFVRLDTLVKTKTPQLVSQSAWLTDADYRAAEVQFPIAQSAMRSGYYLPNRGSMLCSRKSCAYWRECEADFGGQVPA